MKSAAFLLAGAALLTGSSLAFAGTFPVSITQNNVLLGTGTMVTNKANGKITLSLVLHMGQDPRSGGEIKQFEECKADGTPTLTSFEMIQGKASTKITVTYEGRDAILTAVGTKGKLTKRIAAPKGISIVDASSVWFRTVTPKLNKKVTVTNFNPQLMAWQTHTDKYVGNKTLTINGKTYKTHVVIESSGGVDRKFYVDGVGDLVKAEVGNGIIIQRA